MAKSEPGDLAQVHTSGSIEPLEPEAVRSLSAREGLFRVLPSPLGVILMRGVEPEGIGPIRLAGEISAPGAVCDVFSMLAQAGWRGQLALCDVGVTRSLFFDKGNVLGAQTSVDDERLGAVMYRYGVLSEKDLARVAAQTTGGGRFGAIALELELLSQRDVFRCLRHQVEEIAFAAFAQASGTFCFIEGFDAAKLVSHQVISAQALVMDGVTRMDEIRYFREKVPSAEYVPVRVPGVESVTADYRDTYQAIDGQRSIEELGRLTGRGEFAITKDVYGLERAGHVSIQSPRRAGGPAALAELANRLLRAVHADADAAGKGRQLRKGLASFAGGGSGSYGVLFLMAGPTPDGALDPSRLVANLQRLSSESSEASLRRMLYEYVSFAIFCVGAAAGRQREAALSLRLASELQELEPR
jgi:uncharacterized protein DUF4388